MSARARRTAHLEALARAEPRLQAGPMHIAFRLPFPPSVNHYWRHGDFQGHVTVYISTAGTKYRKAVGEEVLRQGVPRFQLTGKLEVKILAFMPDRRARDLDNLFKSLLDSLQHAGVIRDDSEIDYLLIERGPVLTGGCVQVEIAEIAGQATESQPLPLAMRDPITDQALAIMGAG